MADHLAERIELSKRWRIADTRLHRTAALSLRPTAPASAEDLAQRRREHAAASRTRAMILKRMTALDGGMKRRPSQQVACRVPASTPNDAPADGHRHRSGPVPAER